MSVEHEQKPPSRLPNGKANPAYTRWWRSTERGAKSISLSKARPDYLQREAERKRKAYKAVFPVGARTCVECKSVFPTDSVISKGWRLIGLRGTLCDVCAGEGWQ